jgi:hypothetical protein
MKDKIKKLGLWIDNNRETVANVCFGAMTLIAVSALKSARDGEIVAVRTGTWDNGDEVVGIKTRGNGIKTYTKRNS